MQDATQYADFETGVNPTRTPLKLRFGHAWGGHRYIGVSAGVGGVVGGFGGSDSGFGGVPSGSSATGGGAGAAATGGGVGGFAGAGPLRGPRPQSSEQAASEYLAHQYASRNVPDVPRPAAPAPPNLSIGGQEPSGLGGLGYRTPAKQFSERNPLVSGQTGTLPGRPPGPQDVIHVDMTKPCGECGPIRAQIEEVKKSIRTEQRQELQQQLQQQQQQIEQYQESEQRGDTTDIDRKIQEKIGLLQQLEDQLIKANRIALDETTTSSDRLQVTREIQDGVPNIDQTQPNKTGKIGFGHILEHNLLKYLQEAGTAIGCAKVLTKVGVPFPIATALCAGYQAIKGDAKQLADFVQEVEKYLREQPEHPTQPQLPPPAPPKPMEFCVTCESAQDALMYQSGEGNAKCYLVDGSVRSAP